MDSIGSRRLFSLVTMLPADSAIVAVLRPHEPDEKEARKAPGSWGDLAKTLVVSEGMKKKGVSRAD